MKVLCAAAMALLMLSGSAYAQGVNMLNDQRRSEADREKDRQIEENYRAEMKKIPDQKAASDPWGSVRSSDTAQKSAPAARKPKQN